MVTDMRQRYTYYMILIKKVILRRSISHITRQLRSSLIMYFHLQQHGVTVPPAPAWDIPIPG